MRILLLLAVAVLASGQGVPPNPTVTLRIADSHPFRQGELIKAEVNVPNGAAVRTPPPAEQWQFTGILVDPPGDCGTHAKPCFPGATGGANFSRLMNGPQGVSDRRTFPLNHYLPVLAPGRYRVAALARKMVLTQQAPGSTYYGYTDPPQYTDSNPVELDIIPATADWVRLTIIRSVAALRAAEPRDAAAYEAQHDAAEQLSLIDDRAAWTASLDLLPKEEGVLLAGLAGARDAAAVCELMQARVTAPAQVVSQAYIYRLTDVCSRAHLPPIPKLPAATGPAAVLRGETSATPPRAVAPAATPNPEMQAWSQKQRAYTEGLINSTTAALAGSLGTKQPAAKWESFATLLYRIQQVRNNRPPGPDPAWVPLLTTEFVRDYAAVEPARRQYLLDLFSSTVDSPEMAPFLERTLDAWKPGDSYEAVHSALHALHGIDAARARARILAELTKEKTWLDPSLLDFLPASAVPPMDDALIEALAQAQRPGGWNPPLAMAAIARYATAKALPRIRAIYESQQESCQPELLAYFVRVDPAYSERVFRSHSWDMHAMPPRCTIQYFQRTPPIAMNRALEQYLAAYLMHEEVFLKSTAAKALARYGSPAALPPLWDAFRYFHNYWNGKGKELEQNGQGVALEVDLRNAIARGRGWLVSATDLHLIQSLCISNWCAGETRHDLDAMKPPLALDLMPQPQGINGRVAQYYGLESVSAVETKLAQYPSGTRFILFAPAGSKDAAAVLRFAAAKGLIVTPR